MKSMLTVVLALVLAASALAFDLGNRVPDKPVIQHTAGTPDADVLRQGGDTFADAFLISDEFYDTIGSTSGYTDDYDEACPYTQSTSPDVVYRFSPPYHTTVDIDLFGSNYDTKVYVYGAGLELVACNDDYYADYTSRINSLDLFPGIKYYIVIDGYGGAFGQ